MQKPQIDKYTSGLRAAYMKVYEQSISRIIAVLPTLLEDSGNVTVICSEPTERARYPYEVKYKGVTVADFFVSMAEDENHVFTIFAEDMMIYYTDEELRAIDEINARYTN